MELQLNILKCDLVDTGVKIQTGVNLIQFLSYNILCAHYKYQIISCLYTRLLLVKQKCTCAHLSCSFPELCLGANDRSKGQNQVLVSPLFE